MFQWLTFQARIWHERHERLKHTVHTAWRYPLPPWGRFVMGCIYFSIPVVGGYSVMQWAISRSHKSIGERGEKLRIQEVQGVGDKRVTAEGDLERVGAGGYLGGVKLATSDETTQRQNKAMLEAFFRQQRKQRQKNQETKEKHGQGTREENLDPR